MNESNTKARLAFIKFNFQNDISQNTGKCELGGFSLRQSHNYVTIYHDIYDNIMLHCWKFFYSVIKYHSFMIFIIILPNPTLLASLKNLVIGNGDSTYILCTPSWRVYIFDVHSSFVNTMCFIPSQALLFEASLFSGLLGNVIFWHANYPSMFPS